MRGKISITPQTTVSELLDAYPELETKLLASIPALEKLNNPILRKAVARVATLEAAATMAGLPVDKLIAALHKLLGLSEAAPPDKPESPDPPAHEKV